MVSRKHALLTVAVAALVFVAGIHYRPLPAAQAAPADQEITVTVSGQGTVQLVPDLAHLSFGTLTRAATAHEAQARNAQLMANVIQALRGAGIPEAQMRTGGFSLSPVWEHPEAKLRGGPATPQIVGYQVTNTLHVRTTRLQQAGTLIDTAIRAGANTVEGIRFGVSDTTAANLEALTRAHANARAKADRLAAAAGLTVVGIRSMDESGSFSPMPPGGLEFARSMDVATPILPGEMELTAHVTVKFILR
jgi:uncharacterized protein YggE